MAAMRKRPCVCGAPLGVPHYCPAKNNQVGHGFIAPPPPSNNPVAYGAPNRGYNRKPSRPAVAMWPQAQPRPKPPPLTAGGPYYCGGNKRALLCGITYGNGPQSLKGSINDVMLMREFLINNLGFQPHSILVLRDDMYNNPKTMPTRCNMIEAMSWLVTGCREGDSLVFHYSGHGSQVEDYDGDEIDGYDEAICPVDYQIAGKILDDTINDILVKPLPRGAKLHAIIDTCKSGTVLDLRFMCRMNRIREYIWDDQLRGRPHYKGTNGGIAICISACDDDGSAGDTSAFGNGGGALTHSFINAMKRKQANGLLNYGDLLYSMRSITLQAKQKLGFNCHALNQQFYVNHRLTYSNEPQLSSSETFQLYSRPVAI